MSEPINMIPVRGFVPPANVNPAPRQLSAPSFDTITRNPMAPVTNMPLGQPMNAGAPQTVVSAPAIPSQGAPVSPAVRSLR
ncbi:MAG: hypothetical protein ABSC25_00815 [Roseiarcus sp.]|jgi:hypothetical protein